MSLIKANKQRRRNVLANAIQNSKSRAKSVAVRTASELSGIPAKNTEAIANFFGVSTSDLNRANGESKAVIASHLRNV